MAHSKLYVKIMNSARWRLTRNSYLSEHPLCEECKRRGMIKEADCVHHLQPIETGRSEAECWQLATRSTNLQALCYSCHSDIHYQERSHSKEVHQQRTQERLAAWISKRKEQKETGLTFGERGE